MYNGLRAAYLERFWAMNDLEVAVLPLQQALLLASSILLLSLFQDFLWQRLDRNVCLQRVISEAACRNSCS